MKKIKSVLVISGSPRKHGNSETLAQEVARGAKDAGLDVTFLRLADYTVKYCTGCGLCSFHGKPCPIKDDAKAIQEQMLAADCIVMATPVYFYAICAQLKTLIDRSSPYYTQMTGKHFGFVMTSADDNPACMDRTLEDFRGYLDCLDDPRERFVLRGVGLTHPTEAKDSPYMEEAYAAGKGLAKAR